MFDYAACSISGNTSLDPVAFVPDLACPFSMRRTSRDWGVSGVTAEIVKVVVKFKKIDFVGVTLLLVMQYFTLWPTNTEGQKQIILK